MGGRLAPLLLPLLLLAQARAAPQPFHVPASATRCLLYFPIPRSWYDTVVAARDDICALMTLEAGKPLAESRAEFDNGWVGGWLVGGWVPGAVQRWHTLAA